MAALTLMSLVRSASKQGVGVIQSNGVPIKESVLMDMGVVEELE